MNPNPRMENRARDLHKQINEQTVIQSELKQLKPKAKVYHQQQNSNIFFLSSRDKEMSRAKVSDKYIASEVKRNLMASSGPLPSSDTLDALRKEYAEAEKDLAVNTDE